MDVTPGGAQGGRQISLEISRSRSEAAVGSRASRIRKLSHAPLALGLMLACASAAAQDPGEKKFAPEQIKKGAALYASHCESCHGVRMIGPPWAIDLKTFPRDSPARFADSVTYGVRGMPPWGDVIKPDEIEALWAYVVAGEKK
jgi:mono/diheme cytochrome c family protein